jgi:uncharacterized protein
MEYSHGQASKKLYLAMLLGGLGIGLLVSWFRLQPLIDYKFNNFDYTKNVPFEYYELSRTLRAIGIFGLIMVLYKSGLFKWLFALMRPVGSNGFYKLPGAIIPGRAVFLWHWLWDVW